VYVHTRAGSRRRIYFQAPSKYMTADQLAKADKGVGFMPNAKVEALDADRQLVTLANGDTGASLMMPGPAPHPSGFCLTLNLPGLAVRSGI
jgi:hypothetical protein